MTMSRRTARSRRTTAPDGCARCPRSSSRRPLHAIWNLLLRRAGGSNTVAALSIVAEAVLLLPLAAAVLISSGGVPVGRFVPAIVVAAAPALAARDADVPALHRLFVDHRRVRAGGAAVTTVLRALPGAVAWPVWLPGVNDAFRRLPQSSSVLPALPARCSSSMTSHSVSARAAWSGSTR